MESLQIRICSSGAILALLAGCASPAFEKPRPLAWVSEGTEAVPPHLTTLPEVRIADRRSQSGVAHFAKFGQCQIEIALTSKPNLRGLWDSGDPSQLLDSLHACLRTAVAQNVDVLVLPELSLALPDKLRDGFLETLSKTSQSERMIVVAGSYYDSSRYSRLVVVGPGWIERGYKIRPSRFEASPVADEGMRPGLEMLVLKSDFGTMAIITCVDLISDEVQFLVRRLATRGEIDTLININHNPASWEFLVETNSIVRRHPIFASVTNVFVSPAKASKDCLKNEQPVDTGYCHGHTSIFASLRTSPSDLPNSNQRLLPTLPDPVVVRSIDGSPVGIALPYSNVAADIGAFREGLLVYELNMLLKREPNATNAPDQGYPPIRGIKIVSLAR